MSGTSTLAADLFRLRLMGALEGQSRSLCELLLLVLLQRIGAAAGKTGLPAPEPLAGSICQSRRNLRALGAMAEMGAAQYGLTARQFFGPDYPLKLVEGSEVVQLALKLVEDILRMPPGQTDPGEIGDQDLQMFAGLLEDQAGGTSPIGGRVPLQG